MKHGPIALIDERMPVVTHRAARSRVREDDRQHAGSESARRLRHRADDARRRTAARRFSTRQTTSIIEVPPAPELLTPIVMVLPLQLLAYRHRGPPRLRRRSAAEPREERHGRIDGGPSWPGAARRLLVPSPSPRCILFDSLNPEQRDAVLHIEGPAADSRRRRLRQNTRHHAAASPTSSATAMREPHEVLAVTFTNKAAEEMRGARRVAARLRLQRHVGVDVPRALRAAAAPRGARHRPVARLRHLRLVGPALGRQAGDEGAADRRQLHPAQGGAVADQPREEQAWRRPRPMAALRRLEPARRAASRRSTPTT